MSDATICKHEWKFKKTGKTHYRQCDTCTQFTNIRWYQKPISMFVCRDKDKCDTVKE